MSNYDWTQENSNFAGYYLKIDGCKFDGITPLPGETVPAPAMKREGLKVLPKLVQVTDEQRVASGKLYIKELPHKPSKFELTFPIMTRTQYNICKRAFRGELTSEDEMYLTVEYYDEDTDTYKTGTFYHTDISYTPVIYQGQRMILLDTIKLIEH